MKYHASFNKKDISNLLRTSSSNGELEVKLLREYNRLHVKGKVLFADTCSPEFSYGFLDIYFRAVKEVKNIGAIIKYSDENNWLSIGCDNEGKWGWETAKGDRCYEFEGPVLQAGRTYNFKIRHTKDKISLWVGEEKIFEDILVSAPPASGKIGFRAGNEGTEIAIDDIYCWELKDISSIPKQIPVENSIESAKLAVTLDETFPRVIAYRLAEGGAIIYGQEDVLNEIIINDSQYTPAVKFAKTSQDKAIYTMIFDEIKVRMCISIEVVDNVLNFNITHIEEEGNELVKTVEIPNHSLVSVRTSQGEARVTAARISGILTSTDEFNRLLDMPETGIPVEKTLVILSTDKIAASIDNNVLYKQKRVLYQTQSNPDYKRCGVWNGVWTYREIDSEIYMFKF